MANEKRLIDAYALERRIVEMCKEPNYQHSGEDWRNGLCMAMEAVSEMPTVYSVEVKHGRWLPDMEEFDDDPAVGIRGGVFQTGWKCSICGRSEPVKEPYCNCGADMR